jgi:MFS-type transporter involved in bile tolerance (Atg22 family)
MNSLVVIMIFGCTGSIEPIVAPFIEENFGDSKVLLASLCILPAIAYPVAIICMSNFLKNTHNKFKMMLGLAFGGAAMIFIGPCDIFGLSPHLFITGFSLFMIGLATAFSFINCLPDMIDDSTGYFSGIEPSLVSDRLSALLNLSIYIGKAVFSTLAGTLDDYYGFSNATAIIGVLILIYCLIYGQFGDGFKTVYGRGYRKPKIQNLLSEKEMVESKKSFYLLEEDDV